MRQVQVLVIARPDPLRLYPAEDQAGHHGFVRVPADQQVTLAAGHGQHGCFDRQRAAAGGKEGPVRADGIGHQLLGPGQIAMRGLAVIQPSRGEQVRTERVLADDGTGPRVRAAALAVPRRREPVPAKRVIVRHGIQHRRSTVIHSDHRADLPYACGCSSTLV
jgi:hypothetical protein